MMLSHCDHQLKQTKNKSVSYCDECGCLKYKDNVTEKPKDFKIRREVDPTEVFAVMKEKIDNMNLSLKKMNGPSILENVKLGQRKRSLAFIKFLINKFNLDKRIFHACVSLMDYLLKIKPEEILSNTDMYILSILIIIIKYGENGVNATKIKNFVLNSEDKKQKYKEYESQILRWIHFDISLFFIDYDVLNLLIENGILFEGEKVKNMEYIYCNCFLLLNSVKEKNYCMKYDSMQIAFSIVYVIRNAFGLEDKNKIFEEIYGYHFDCFRGCYETLKGQIKLKYIFS